MTRLLGRVDSDCSFELYTYTSTDAVEWARIAPHVRPCETDLQVGFVSRYNIVFLCGCTTNCGCVELTSLP